LHPHHSSKNCKKCNNNYRCDGGPLACQGVAVNGLVRDFCGGQELANDRSDLKLVRPLIGRRRWALPIVFAVLPNAPR
jgi:hypothetical protein